MHVPLAWLRAYLFGVRPAGAAAAASGGGMDSAEPGDGDVQEDEPGEGADDEPPSDDDGGSGMQMPICRWAALMRTRTRTAWSTLPPPARPRQPALSLRARGAKARDVRPTMQRLADHVVKVVRQAGLDGVQAGDDAEQVLTKSATARLFLACCEINGACPYGRW